MSLNLSRLGHSKRDREERGPTSPRRAHFSPYALEHKRSRLLCIRFPASERDRGIPGTGGKPISMLSAMLVSALWPGSEGDLKYAAPLQEYARAEYRRLGGNGPAPGPDKQAFDERAERYVLLPIGASGGDDSHFCLVPEFRFSEVERLDMMIAYMEAYPLAYMEANRANSPLWEWMKRLDAMIESVRAYQRASAESNSFLWRWMARRPDYFDQQELKHQKFAGFLDSLKGKRERLSNDWAANASAHEQPPIPQF